MDQSDSNDRKHKTTKSRRETAVQGTNDNSILSKCSMSAAGYFQDLFLKEFVSKNSKRAPLINRGYYLRATCIDQVLKQFLKKNQGGKKQIVSLGAGFDSAYFRLKSDGFLQDTSFFEIDFPEVTKRKHAIIESKSLLSDLLNSSGEAKKVVPPIEFWTSDYCLLGVDLTQLNTLEAALRMCGADFDTPTLFLSECVMTYMTRRCSSSLVKWAGETFQDALFVMFEQINPDDAFGIFMQNHFHTIGSPLKCITSFPTVDSQIKRFLDLGWQKCKCVDLNEMYRHSLTPEERARIETLDPFDEYEEFNLKCAHYFVLVASTLSPISDYLFSPSAQDFNSFEVPPVSGLVSVSYLPSGQSNVKRFSHSSVLLAERFILTAGGFGEVDSRHQRVQEVSLTDTFTMETKLIRCHSNDVEYSRMHHSALALSDGRMLLCGGRQSPFFLCSQILVFELHVHADNSCDSNAPELSPMVTDATGVGSNISKTQSYNSTTGNGSTIAKTLSNSNSGDNAQMNSGDQREGAENRESTKTNSGDDAKNNSVDKRKGAENGDSTKTNSSALNKASLCDTTSEDSYCSGNLVTVQSNSQISHHSEKLVTHSSNTQCECGVTTNSGDGDCEAICGDGVEVTNFEGGYLTCSVLKQSGDTPCQRWRHATALVNIKGTDCVFLHGGRTQNAEVLSDMYMLEVASGVWRKLNCSGDCPGALHSHTMVTWGEGEAQRVVVVGGMDEDQLPQSSIFILDPFSLTWERLQVKGTFMPRYSHTCHMVGDRLVTVGGVNLCRNTPGVAIVNLRTGQAQEFTFPSVSKSHMLMFHRHCSVMLPDSTIVVLGGGGNCFSFGTHLNSTPITLDISRCLENMP